MSYDLVGMNKISRNEAVGRWENNQEVFLLYDNDTEGVANTLDEIQTFEGEFGYEGFK